MGSLVKKTPEVIDIAAEESEIEFKGVTSMTQEEKKERHKVLMRRLCRKRKTPCE